VFSHLLKAYILVRTKKKIYSVEKKHDKYFLLFLFLDFSDKFAPLFGKIKNKYFCEYLNNTDKILKSLDEPYSRFNSRNFFILQCVAMFFGVLLSFLSAGFDIVIIIAAGILFFILPYIKIYEEHKKKIGLIIKQLPNLADLLSIMIASGIDFNNSLIKISLILQGPLSHELKTVISKVSFGIDLKKALNEMAEKYNIDQLNLLVRTVNSTLESGLGITDALNKISEQIKSENSALAEKKAHEAPVKILVPMTFLILPTVFILLFAPIIISFFKNGSLF